MTIHRVHARRPKGINAFKPPGALASSCSSSASERSETERAGRWRVRRRRTATTSSRHAAGRSYARGTSSGTAGSSGAARPEVDASDIVRTANRTLQYTSNVTTCPEVYVVYELAKRAAASRELDRYEPLSLGR